MRIQRATEKRFIHPHIYDWPLRDALTAEGDADHAGHGVLDWRAASAAEVVGQLDAGWERVESRHHDVLSLRVGRREISVRRDRERPAVETADDGAEPFDVVVLAVGFGRDDTAATDSYWADTSIDHMSQESGGTWFVSGHGDGGLTDLMRLCVMDFCTGAPSRGSARRRARASARTCAMPISTASREPIAPERSWRRRSGWEMSSTTSCGLAAPERSCSTAPMRRLCSRDRARS